MELTLRDREIVLRPKVEQKGTTNQELREHLRSLLIQAKSTGQLHKEIDFGMEGNENI